MKRRAESKPCPICGCRIYSGGKDYAQDNIEGRSHASSHHYVAERFLGRSKNSKGKVSRKRIFETCPWEGMEGKSDKFCYDCHEELLHNPVFKPEDIKRFAELVRLKGLNEPKKAKSKDKIAGRIKLLHEAIEKGIDALLAEKRR